MRFCYCFFFISVVFTFKIISLFVVFYTAICYMLLYLCKLLSPLLQPHALVASLLLTRFCNQVFCNICKTLMFYGDAGPGRWERWKGDQTFPLLFPERHTILIFWWFCGCILIDLQIKMVILLVQNVCLSASLSLAPAVPLACVTQSWLDYAYFHNRLHSSALWQLCKDTQL